MSLPYASTSASSSRKLLIRDASSRLSARPSYLSGDLLAKRESLGTWRGSCNKSSRKLYEISSISLDWYLDLMRVEIEVGSKS